MVRCFFSAAAFALYGLPALAAECGNWNTQAFFKTASVTDVGDCLDAGAEVNAKNELGWTPLLFAVLVSKNPAVIEALIAAGADVNARSEDGFTALLITDYFNGNPAVTEALIAAGGD
jgi:ankyrin repeat protein